MDRVPGGAALLDRAALFEGALRQALGLARRRLDPGAAWHALGWRAGADGSATRTFPMPRGDLVMHVTADARVRVLARTGFLALEIAPGPSGDFRVERVGPGLTRGLLTSALRAAPRLGIA